MTAGFWNKCIKLSRLKKRLALERKLQFAEQLKGIEKSLLESLLRKESQPELLSWHAEFDLKVESDGSWLVIEYGGIRLNLLLPKFRNLDRWFIQKKVHLVRLLFRSQNFLQEKMYDNGLLLFKTRGLTLMALT